MKRFALSDEQNRQTGETERSPTTGRRLFGLYGFAETPTLAVNQGRQRICGLFGLYGRKCHKALRNGRGRKHCHQEQCTARQRISSFAVSVAVTQNSSPRHRLSAVTSKRFHGGKMPPTASLIPAVGVRP